MAIEIIRLQKADKSIPWEEKSGLLDFLSTVYAEVTRARVLLSELNRKMSEVSKVSGEPLFL